MIKLKLPTRHDIPGRGRLYLVFGAVALLLALLMPRARQFEYDYHKGSPWKYPTLVADMDFPIYKSQAQIQQELSEGASPAIPYYRYSEDITDRLLAAVEALSMDSATARQGLLSTLRRIYSKGVLPEDVQMRKGMEYDTELVYVQKDKRVAKYPVTELYKLSEVKPRLVSELSARLGESGVDAMLRSAGVYDLLTANLVYDQQTTTLIHLEQGTEVSPTQGYVSSGTIIVSEGEIVTAEIKQMLDSYKREYDSSTGADTPAVGIFAGNLLVSIALVLVLLLTIYFSAGGILARRKQVYYLIFVYLLAAVPILLLGGQDAGERTYMFLPLTLVALYLQAFFLNEMIIPVYLSSLLPLLIATPHGSALYVMFALSGLVSTLMFGRFFKGAQQFIPATMSFLTLVLTYLGFRLLSVFVGNAWGDIFALFIGSMLAVAAYPLIFVFEKLFGLLSNSTLEQLSDTGNKLLRELETKAPGTFQHSLQVMTMADAAARSIGADTHLVRAGALYHDIGKMLNPRCFVENESLTGGDGDDLRYHAELTPAQSAADIIRHVTDGAELARSRHLPSEIVDFILTHHGTTCTAFFYDKYLRAGGDPARRPDFCYPGPRPSTREQAVLMICDSVEAASRTLKDYSPKGYDALVEKIVDGKLQDGQLSCAQITIKELETVKEALKAYLAQLYHERVVYPTGKRK